MTVMAKEPVKGTSKDGSRTDYWLVAAVFLLPFPSALILISRCWRARLQNMDSTRQKSQYEEI